MEDDRSVWEVAAKRGPIQRGREDVPRIPRARALGHDYSHLPQGVLIFS